MKLTERFIALKKCIQEEKSQRNEIINSNDYKELEKQMDELTEKRELMLTNVADTTPEYEAFKKEIIAMMKAEGLDRIEDINAKVRIKKEVNTKRLMDELQGDLDHFFVLAKVQQNTLKDFAKSDPRKKDLMACIEEVGKDIIDIELAS